MSMTAFIGLDVGGTKMAAGLVSLPSGKVWRRAATATLPARGGKAVLADAYGLAQALLEAGGELRQVVAGIGIGVPELVGRDGKLVTADVIDWLGLDVDGPFEQLAPARLESDVRAAALAEALFGAGRSCSNFAYLSVGTGISHTLVLDGRPYAGARGNALVLGSQPIPCRCGQCGAETTLTLEQMASGPALAEGYRRLTGKTAAGADDVLARAVSGDSAAVQAACSGGRILGGHAAWLVNVLDPERLVVGGGLGLADGHYWESFLSALREHIYAPNTRELPVLQAELGRDAGWIGAAASAWLAVGGEA
jgi:glucokinase